MPKTRGRHGRRRDEGRGDERGARRGREVAEGRQGKRSREEDASAADACQPEATQQSCGHEGKPDHQSRASPKFRHEKKLHGGHGREIVECNRFRRRSQGSVAETVAEGEIDAIRRHRPKSTDPPRKGTIADRTDRRRLAEKGET